MKVGLVFWYIRQIGGILTYTKNLRQGLEKLGHNVEDALISYNKQKLPDKYSDHRFEHVFDRVFGFMKNEWVNDFKNWYEEQDQIIFVNPCPTLKETDGDKSWQKLYNVIDDKSAIAVVHDPYVEERYPWLKDVKHKIKKIVCVQEKAYYTVKEFFAKKTLKDLIQNIPDPEIVLVRHPLDIDDMGYYEKEELMIHTNTWKSWKRNELFIAIVPKILKEFPDITVEVYGDGIEKAKMKGEKRSEKYFINGKWIWDEAIEAGMKDAGIVSDEELIKAYKRAKYHISFALNENYQKRLFPNLDYTDLEAMKYGCILFRPENRAFIKPYENYLPLRDSDLNVIWEDLKNYLNAIRNNKIDTKRMIENNFKTLKEVFDAVKIAEQVIS